MDPYYYFPNFFFESHIWPGDDICFWGEMQAPLIPHNRVHQQVSGLPANAWPLPQRVTGIHSLYFKERVNRARVERVSRTHTQTQQCLLSLGNLEIWMSGSLLFINVAAGRPQVASEELECGFLRCNMGGFCVSSTEMAIYTIMLIIKINFMLTYSFEYMV